MRRGALTDRLHQQGRIVFDANNACRQVLEVFVGRKNHGALHGRDGGFSEVVLAHPAADLTAFAIDASVAWMTASELMAATGNSRSRASSCSFFWSPHFPNLLLVEQVLATARSDVDRTRAALPTKASRV